MDNIKVCRICLNMDVKLHDLRSDPLESYFASIMLENKPQCTTTLPSLVCFECAALVKKFYYFKQKCLKSQAVLCDIIDKCGKISLEILKSIKRPNHLGVSNISHIDIKDDDGSTNYLTVTVEDVGIKKEDNDDILDHHDSLSSDDECKREPILAVEKVEVHVKLDEELVDPPQIEKISVLPLENSPVAKPKKLVRPKRTCNSAKKKPSKLLKDDSDDDSEDTTAKKKPSKVLKDDSDDDSEDTTAKKKPSKVLKNDVENVSEDKTDMEDITVITLSMEEQLEEINKLKQSSNYLNCPYQCHLCYKGFNYIHTWKLHVSKHAPSAGELECVICKYRFKSKRTLHRHALNHSKRYVCKLCPYSSSNVTTVKQHQGSHKGVTHKCKLCNEVFTVKTTYVSHVRQKHPSENICGFCGYSFFSKQGLLVHKNMVHKNDEVTAEEIKESQYCADCDVKFISTEAYKRHMVMSVKHTPNPDVINGCRVCGATFSDPEELRVHNRKEHPKRQPRAYHLKGVQKWPAKCKHCPEMIPTGRAFWRHFRLVHPNENYPVQKKFVCDLCGKRFTCNALLTTHARTHSGERPYKCAHCDKACFSSFDLRVHQQKHSDTRPFVCTLCPRAFKRKEALERHIKTHGGDNAYKCEICGVGFKKSCTRTLHVRTVHTKEPPPHRKPRRKPC